MYIPEFKPVIVGFCVVELKEYPPGPVADQLYVIGGDPSPLPAPAGLANRFKVSPTQIGLLEPGVTLRLPPESLRSSKEKSAPAPPLQVA